MGQCKVQDRVWIVQGFSPKAAGMHVLYTSHVLPGAWTSGVERGLFPPRCSGPWKYIILDQIKVDWIRIYQIRIYYQNILYKNILYYIRIYQIRLDWIRSPPIHQSWQTSLTSRRIRYIFPDKKASIWPPFSPDEQIVPAQRYGEGESRHRDAVFRPFSVLSSRISAETLDHLQGVFQGQFVRQTLGTR